MSGDRKYGRKKRKPAQIRYTQSARWVANKARRIEKEALRQARLAERKAGTR